MVERCEVCGVLLRPSTRPRKATCERGACAQEYRRRLQAEPGVRPCPVCGRKVGPGEAGDNCGDDYCRQELDARRMRARIERERQELREATARRLDRDLRGTPETPAATLTAVLPAHDRPLERLDPVRRTLFSERLAGLLEDAVADPDGPTGDPPSPEGPSGPADVLARSACASCRGFCCKHGETHAFLRPATLRRTLKRLPGQTPAQVLEKYLSHIPAESFAGSCLFHGREGCTLPRALRSDVCNRYLCEDLERLQKVVAAGEGIPPVLAVGFDEERLVRVSLIECGQVRTVSEGSPAGQGS